MAPLSAVSVRQMWTCLPPSARLIRLQLWIPLEPTKEGWIILCVVRTCENSVCCDFLMRWNTRISLKSLKFLIWVKRVLSTTSLIIKSRCCTLCLIHRRDWCLHETKKSTRISSFTPEQPLFARSRVYPTNITWKYIAELLIRHVNPAVLLLYDALKHFWCRKLLHFSLYDKFLSLLILRGFACEKISLNSLFSLHRDRTSWFLGNVNFPFLTDLFTCPLVWSLK